MAELSEVIKVGEWLPDQPDYLAGGALKAQNVLTDGDNYTSFPEISDISNQLGEKCFAAYSYISASTEVTTFAATQTKIYKKNGDSWDDVTNTGGDYLTTSEGNWQFTQFGTMVLATNYVDKIQKFEIGTDTEFGDLITTGPDVKCRNFGVINNFLVCVGINDSDGENPARVRWSPINDPAGDWTPSVTTQSDYQDLVDGNPVAALACIGSQNSVAGQNYGIIVCKNAIYRMDYVGPDTIFTFNLLETERGAVHENAVAPNGANILYLSDNGIFQFDGTRSIPVGHKKVDKYVSEGIDQQYYPNITMSSDPKRKIVLLSYTELNSSSGRNNKTLIYNWADDKFTEIDAGYDVIFRTYTEGYTLDEIAALYPSLDDIPYSLDSRYWQGGVSTLAAFSDDGQMGLFVGDSMTGYIETQDVRINTNGLSFLDSLLPVYEGGTAEAKIGTKMLTSDSVTYGDYMPISSITGEINCEKEARFFRATFRLTDNWDIFQGLQYRAAPAGGI